MLHSLAKIALSPACKFMSYTLFITSSHHMPRPTNKTLYTKKCGQEKVRGSPYISLYQTMWLRNGQRQPVYLFTPNNVAKKRSEAARISLYTKQCGQEKVRGSPYISLYQTMWPRKGQRQPVYLHWTNLAAFYKSIILGIFQTIRNS